MCLRVFFARLSLYHMRAHGGQKRASDPLGLELQMVVSCYMALGVKLVSSVTAASAFNAETPFQPPNVRKVIIDKKEFFKICQLASVPWMDWRSHDVPF